MPNQDPQQEFHSTESLAGLGGPPAAGPLEYHRPLGVLKALTRPVGRDLSHCAHLNVS